MIFAGEAIRTWPCRLQWMGRCEQSKVLNLRQHNQHRLGSPDTGNLGNRARKIRHLNLSQNCPAWKPGTEESFNKFGGTDSTARSSHFWEPWAQAGYDIVSTVSWNFAIFTLCFFVANKTKWWLCFFTCCCLHVWSMHARENSHPWIVHSALCLELNSF